MINQQTIVKFLEDTLPSMQSSADAEVCLMKKAKEANYSPAVFERTCHMFNALKTLNHYDNNEMEKRGSFTATLNVPSLVERYSDFTKDITDALTSRECGSASSQLDDLFGEGSFVAVKTASSSDGCRSIEVLFADDNSVSLEDVTLSNKVPETPARNKIASDYYNYLEDKRVESDVFREVREALFREKSDVLNKVASIYVLADETPSAFNVISKYAMHFRDESKHDVQTISDSCQDLFNLLQTKGGTVAVKTACIEEVPQKISLLSNSSDIKLLDLVYKFADINSRLSALNELKAQADAVTFEPIKTATASKADKDSDDSKHTDKDLIAGNTQKVTHEGKTYEIDLDIVEHLRDDPNSESFHKAEVYVLSFPESIQDALVKYITKQDGSAAKIGPKVVNTPNFTTAKTTNTPPTDAYISTYAPGGVDVKFDDLKKDAPADTPGALFGQAVSKTVDVIPSALSVAHSSFNSANANILKQIAEKMKATPDTSLKENMLDSMRAVESNARLNELLFTDPVLSKLNNEQLNNVLEAYSTIGNMYPALLTDTATLRAYLRSAASSGGGVDLNTTKMLSEIKKNMGVKNN